MRIDISKESGDYLMTTNSAYQFFFDVSLPQCVLSEKPLDHVLFICEEPGAAEEFLKHIRSVYSRGDWKELRNVEHKIVQSTLGSMDNGDVLCYSARSYLARRTVTELFSDAMENNAIHILLGDGTDIRLQLPSFTLVMCVEQNSPSLESLIPYFGHVIYLESNCAQYLAKLASAKGFEIDAEAAQYLCDTATNDYRCAKRYLMRTIEYITVKESTKKRIDLQTVQTTVDFVRVALPAPSCNELQDVVELLHELSDQVKKIDGNVALLQSNYSMLHGLD